MKQSITLCWFLFCSTQAFTQSAQAYYEAGLQRLQAKDLPQAMVYFKEAGDQNHAEALFVLGSINYRGDRYERDFLAPIPNEKRGYWANTGKTDHTEAYFYFHRAASNGSAEGMNALGVMYENGEALSIDYLNTYQEYHDYMNNEYVKVEDNIDPKAAGLVYQMTTLERQKVQDYPLALHYYEQAATKGHPQAMYRAARFYLEGKGVDKDEAKGIEWVQECAGAQEPICVFMMGAAYEAGFQVERDLSTALEFYRAAERLEHLDAIFAVQRLRIVLEVDENGQLRDYHDNGELAQLATYKDGKRHGDFVRYYDDGTFREKGKYLNGTRDGERIEYYNNGEVYLVESFAGGVQIGVYQRFYENGQVEETGRYEDGSQDGEWQTFYENGKPKSVGAYRAGRKHGEWEYFNERGRRTNRERYENGTQAY